MKMERSAFEAKLSEYLVKRFIPKVSNPATRFLLGAAAGSGALSLSLVGEGPLRAAGICAEDGTVDVDALRKAVMAGFDASGGKFPVNRLGLESLDRADAEDFLGFLEPKPAA